MFSQSDLFIRKFGGFGRNSSIIIAKHKSATPEAILMPISCQCGGCVKFLKSKIIASPLNNKITPNIIDAPEANKLKMPSMGVYIIKTNNIAAYIKAHEYVPARDIKALSCQGSRFPSFGAAASTKAAILCMYR